MNNLLQKMKKNWQMVALISVAILIRLIGINWDTYPDCPANRSSQAHVCHDRIYHFHPDERMIIMVADRIRWVNPILYWDDFVDPQSPLNPHFFAYGSFPIYLLAFAGYVTAISNWIVSISIYAVIKLFLVSDQAPISSEYLYQQSMYWAGYDGLAYVGRILSICFDVATSIVIYKLVSFFKEKPNPIVAAAAYVFFVFPIQLSHFYTSDSILNFFIISTVYWCIKYIKLPSLKYQIAIAVTSGLAVASKISGLILFFPITFVLLCVLKNEWAQGTAWQAINKQIAAVIVILFVGMVVVISTQPYLIIDFNSYMQSVREQSRMGQDPWVFPYTRQYVDTQAYVYPLKQIANWGLGWGMAIATLIGFGYAIVQIFKKRTSLVNKQSKILLIGFALIYIGIWGRFSVKFMRYMLPLYPLFAIWIGDLLGALYQQKNSASKYIPMTAVFSSGILWLYAFMQIYAQPNTRIQASIWINEHIPAYSTIAVEHWDDQVPVPPWSSTYTFQQLPLYEYDSPNKWQQISKILETSDVIVLASNRLSAPLSRLPSRYAQSEQYYQLLLNDQLGFKKAADFHVMPRLGRWVFDTQAADESFQVYDHPQVIVLIKEHFYESNWYYQKITN